MSTHRFSRPRISTTRSSYARGAAAAIALLLAAVSTAPAQWSSVVMPPPAWQNSFVAAVDGGVPFGRVSMDGGNPNAGYWSGTVGSLWTSIHPVGAISSAVTGSSITQQAGWVFAGGSNRASRWSGTAASWQDLSPAGSTSSIAYGMDGTTAVGFSQFGVAANPRAGLWTSDAASWISLHPATSPVSSVAFGGGGGRQFGHTVNVGDNRRAALWSGSAGSYVDLQPALAHRSTAWDTDGVHQVGWADLASGGTVASLWSGSAASWVNLHPAGVNSTQANGVWGDWQIGQAPIGTRFTASVWNGTPDSWFDLGSTLHPLLSNSVATSIWSDGATLHVGGWARSSLTNNDVAVLWTRAIPAPGSAALMSIGGMMILRRRRARLLPATSPAMLVPSNASP